MQDHVVRRFLRSDNLDEILKCVCGSLFSNLRVCEKMFDLKIFSDF